MVAVLRLVALVVVAAGFGTACSPAALDDSVAVTHLRNDLHTPAVVAICADDGCAALAGSVTDTLNPGHTMPVNVSVDTGETYAVNVNGQSTKCLPIPPHPTSEQPTLLLSTARQCDRKN